MSVIGDTESDNVGDVEEEVVVKKPRKVVVEVIDAPKLKNMRVRLVDHETRDRMGSQGVIYTTLLASNYNSQEEMNAAKKLLMDDQRMRNSAYDSIHKPVKGVVATLTKIKELKPIVKFPEVEYMSEPTLHLDEGTGNTVMLVGSSKSGKTTVQMGLYNKYFTDYISILFAQNAQLPQYKAKNLIRSDEYLPKIIDICRRINKEKGNKFDFLFMFDDMVHLKGEKNIADLYLSLRNSNISSIISLQYLNLMNKACRGSVNTIFAGSCNSDENILVLIKCYLLSYFKRLNIVSEIDMINYYRELTKNHGFICINPSRGEVSFLRMKL